jgi:hypothetical protein
MIRGFSIKTDERGRVLKPDGKPVAED